MTVAAVRTDSSGGILIKKFNSTTFIALCTGGALMAFAFGQGYESHFAVPAVAFYLAAAVICLLPVFTALVRRKVCARSQ